jgi:hypothetical protein
MAGAAFETSLGRAAGILLMETAGPLAKAFARFARRVGVRTTVLQHGILAGAFSYRQTEGDQVAAWGTADATWFRTNLTGPVRVEATGNPRYDALAGARPEGGRMRDAPQDMRVALFASQPFVPDRALRSPWERFEAMRMALDAVAELPQYVLVVKWHPSEGNRGELPKTTLPRERIRTVAGGDTLRLIRQSDVVLVLSSTVALEAMMFGVPVIFLGAPDLESPFHPPEDGGGLRARTSADLAGHLASLQKDSGFREAVLEGERRFLQERYAPMDGHAAERVVRLLGQG